MRQVETFEIEIGEGENARPAAIFRKTDMTTNEVTYHSQAQFTHPMVGPVPINFTIEAESLEEAEMKFGPHLEVAKVKAEAEINEHIRQQQQALAVPQGGGNILGPTGDIIGMPTGKNQGGPMQFPGGKK